MTTTEPTANELYVDDMVLYSRIGATRRLPSQEKFARLAMENRYVLNIGGWRSGKSVEVCVQGIMAALEHPGSLGGVFREVEASIDDSILRTWFALCPPELIEDYNISRKHLKLRNGSEVIFRGFDKVAYLSKLRSVELDWFIVCQAEEISLEDFRLLQSRLNGRKGPRKGWLEANPAGQNWLWTEFIDNPKPGFAYVQSCTLENRENLPQGYVEDLLAVEDEEWKRRFIYGESVVFTGQVFPQFSKERHVVSPEQLPQVERYVLAKDWGWSAPGVSLVCGVTGDGTWVVVEEVFRRALPVTGAGESWTAIDAKLVREYGIQDGVADPSRPDLISLYNELGLPLRGVRAPFAESLGRLQHLLVNGKLKISRACSNLAREFQSYKYRVIQGVPIDRPVKQDDHGLDALRLAVWGGEESVEVDWLSDWPEPVEVTERG